MWKTLPYTAEIDTPTEYFYFAAHWWRGPNVDAGIWWCDRFGGCRFKSIETGEGVTELPAFVTADHEIPCDELSSLLNECVEAGIYEMNDDNKRRVLGVHFDTIIAIKCRGRSEHKYRIVAGAKNAEHLRILQIVRKYGPSLFPLKRTDMITEGRRLGQGG